ncbi:MAG: hypothetical protein JKY42_07360 [Flavobacteriales bacterium]|nr:hypothetical protein [Flavobacteriales bacterium]
MKINTLVALSILLSICSYAQEVQTISFLSIDSLEITADLYKVDDNKPYMLLCHQAGYSRAEYRETAPMFNQMGYNCLAIDQRSGNAVYKVINETAKRATDKGLRRMYIDAYQDMEASLIYLYKKGDNKKVVLVGSSYSAALVFKLAVDHPEMVLMVMAFSPGEYIQDHSVKEWVQQVTVPVFITSSKSEIPVIKMMIEGGANKKLVHFLPEQEGIHGSRALWKTTPNNSKYWEVVTKFLSTK